MRGGPDDAADDAGPVAVVPGVVRLVDRRLGALIGIAQGHVGFEPIGADVQSASGRVGTTDEIATAAAFLLGPDATFITGSDLLIGGGVIAAIRAGRVQLGN